MRRALCGIVAAIAGGLLLAGCGGAQRVATLSESDVDAFLATAIAEGTAPTDSASFCVELSDDRQMCESSAMAASERFGAPPATADVLCARLVSGTSAVARIRAGTDDGASVVSEIEIIRTPSGEVRAVDPVFWIPRVITAETSSRPDGSSVLGDTCS